VARIPASDSGNEEEQGEMKFTDPRLWEAKNTHDFRFRLHFNDEDVPRRTALISYVDFVSESFITPSDNRVWGIDISSWNGIVDLSKAKAMGCSFVIIKGCDGTIPTKNFEQNKANAKLNGLPWGVYDWLYPARVVNILAQATAWWRQVEHDYPPIGVWVDYESTKYAGQPANPNGTDLQSVTNSYKTLAGQAAGVYSSKGYTDSYPPINPSQYRWWVANYGVTSPLMPHGVVAWIFWQFTSFLDGANLGINALEGDGNYYWGTKEQFNREFGLSNLPTQPPTGETMQWYEVKTAKLNIRSVPGLNSYGQAIGVDIGDLFLGDKIETSERSGDWVRITQIQRAAWPTPEPLVVDSWCLSTYCVAIAPPVEPPPAGLPTLTVTVAVDGYQTVDGQPSASVEFKPL
jgi:GH25 family lysozyme M1 (1,4-beta-N-acetylmuramidase)